MVLGHRVWRRGDALGKHRSVGKDRSWHLAGCGETGSRRGAARLRVSVQEHGREVMCVCVCVVSEDV